MTDTLDSTNKQPWVQDFTSRHAQEPELHPPACTRTRIAISCFKLYPEQVIRWTPPPRMPWAQGSLPQHVLRCWTTSSSIPWRLQAPTWEGSSQLLQIPQTLLTQQVDEASHDLGRWRLAAQSDCRSNSASTTFPSLTRAPGSVTWAPPLTWRLHLLLRALSAPEPPSPPIRPRLL